MKLAILTAALLTLVGAVPAQTLSDSEKVALVFPFEVGQEYQFKSSGNFYRPNGEIWPADSVATITITDTLIDGKTYLHIPFWSPFGSEYYRLDDSMRVWNYVRREYVVGAGVLMNLGAGKWRELTPFGEGLSHWSYPEAYDLSSYRCGPQGGCSVMARGWITTETETFFRYDFILDVMVQYPLTVYAVYSADSSGTSHHRTQRIPFVPERLWGLFRPKSDEPWPNFDQVVEVKQPPTRPRKPFLSIYPNPFNAVTTIRYAVLSKGFVTLRIYNLAGQVVRTVLSQQSLAGTYTVSWDGRDSAGRPLASGVYLVRLTTGDATRAARVTLVR